jgi:hypothetical protein
MIEIGKAMVDLKNRLHPPGGDYIPEWKRNLPSWSMWEPGMPGKPDHRPCLGTGYYRVDLPLEHPEFGQLQKCECTKWLEERRLQGH